MNNQLKASAYAKKHRLMRLVIQPWKTLYPLIIQLFHLKKEIKALTFWGGNLNVILPESVSTQIWRYGFFEADVSIFMINYLKEGMTFVDVGGHYGFFTLLGSYLVGDGGKVIAFEPTPSTYFQLKKNISLYSPHLNVKAIECAAYSENTLINFYDYGLEGSAHNSAFALRTAAGSYHNNMKEVVVQGKIIDDLLKEMGVEGLDLIKIDAESSELHVLNGMTNTIDTDKPNIIMEVGDSPDKNIPTSKEAIFWLQKRGYKVYEIDNYKIVPHVSLESYGHGNLFFSARDVTT